MKAKEIKIRSRLLPGDGVYVITANKYRLRSACPICGGTKGRVINGNIAPCCPSGQVTYTATRYSYNRQEISNIRVYGLGNPNVVMATTDSLKKEDIWFHANYVVVTAGMFDEQHPFEDYSGIGEDLLFNADERPQIFHNNMEAITARGSVIICLTEDRAAHICRVQMEYERNRLRRYNAISGTAFEWPWDEDIKAYAAADSKEDGFENKNKKQLKISTCISENDTIFKITDCDGKYYARKDKPGVNAEIDRQGSVKEEVWLNGEAAAECRIDPSVEDIKAAKPGECRTWIFMEADKAKLACDIMNGNIL